MEINQEFLDTYNPANARELSKKEVAAMKDFTPEMIRALAKEFPNIKTGAMGYLVLGDKRVAPEKQIHPASTWQNLDALIRQGEKSYYAESFKVIFKGRKAPLKVAPVQDLTQDEKNNAEGLKKGKDQNAKEGKTSNKVAEEQDANEVVEENNETVETVESLVKGNTREELVDRYTEAFGIDPGKATKAVIAEAIVNNEMIPG